MIFGHDKYVKIEDYHLPFPLPNARVDADTFKRDYNSLSAYNCYSFLFKEELEFKKNNFSHDSIENLLPTGEFFVYSLLIKTKSDLKDLCNDNIIKIPESVLYAIKTNQCKILLCYIMEGDFYNSHEVTLINNFVSKYNLTKKDVIFLNGNLKKTHDKLANFTIRTFNYFLSNPWFIPYDLLDHTKDSFLQNIAENRLHYTANYEKPKKFLSFNRRPRPHRVALFAELNKDKEIAKNTISSLGSPELEGLGIKNNTNYFYKIYNQFIEEDYSNNKQTGLEFYQNNPQEEFISDSNLNFNLAFNLNESAHDNTFVNVLTETLHENETIFLSEKIFKPIYCCQPFIVFGNPGTLKELHNLGFKTFSDFWDESYDEDYNFTSRLGKIMSIIHELNNKNSKELLKISNRMIPILRHNFTNYFEAARSEHFNLRKILHDQFA